jgi:hypothetical protein
MNRRRIALLGIAMAVPLAAAPAFAHHSYAEFDIDHPATLDGTVKAFEWTNPHSWIHIVVLDANGQLDQWAIEMDPPTMLAGRGWKPKTIVPGDKVTVTFQPMKSGAHAGKYLSIKLPDGQVMTLGARTRDAAK